MNPIPDWSNTMPWDLEPHFGRWMTALTTEGLHAKSDIAVVLAMLDRNAEAAASAEVAELVRFVGRIARLTANQQMTLTGPFQMSGDDAVLTLSEIIVDARGLMRERTPATP